MSVLTISERHVEYARTLFESFLQDGIRAELNTDNEKIGYKIREATLLKTPYMCIVGDREAANGVLNVRTLSGENLGEMSIEKIKSILKEGIKNRR